MGRFDPDSFTIAFKGVLLEGLEVAFIVLTFGANQHNVGLAAAAGGVAVLVVVIAGLAVHAPLARVPENTLKFAGKRYSPQTHQREGQRQRRLL